MTPRMYPYAVLSSGFLLLSTGLSSCALLSMVSSGGPETPRTLGARMEKHTEVLQKDIGVRNASQPKSMEAAAEYIAGNFSDMGYAVTMQPISGGNAEKGAAIYNILVYKPGLYSNNQSIVVGANYDSSGRRNNGSGTALLLETARGLKDIPTNHNIYFVAYANGAEPAGKSISSGACVHAGSLSGNIGATNILGMINLEPQKLDAGGERKQTGPESTREDVLFMTTSHGREIRRPVRRPLRQILGTGAHYLTTGTLRSHRQRPPLRGPGHSHGLLPVQVSRYGRPYGRICAGTDGYDSPGSGQ